MSKTLKYQTGGFSKVAGGIVCAYVSNNSVPTAALPGLIRSVSDALDGLADQVTQSVAKDPTEKLTSKQIRKSVTPDGIISFLDGKTYKTMKRHLTGHGLDPSSYRARFGLPADYPVVAANYAAKRSELAKAIGLGRIGSRSGAI